MGNLLVAGFFGCILLLMIIVVCVIITKIIICFAQTIWACYKCIFPDDEPNTWHFGCCCCDIMVDCSCPCYFQLNCIALTRTLCNKINFHCCNQWGCMARHFGCRCCRKSIKKIVPIKKNYTNNHIIIINPYDDNYKIGTISKTVNIV